MLSGLGQNTLGGLIIDTRELVNIRTINWNTENLATSNWQGTTELNMSSVWTQENLSSTSWNKEL